MVLYPEIKKILDNLPEDLNDVAFLSDAYRTLSAYDGEELSKQVKNALSRIKKFIDAETQKLYPQDSLSPENAVVLNDYLSIYKEDELNTNQKQLRTDIAPLLDKFDQENDISVNSTANINNIQNTWEDVSAGAIPVFSINRDNKIVIANEYKEFEQLLSPLKKSDLQEFIDVLHVNTIQDLAKTGATSLSGDAQLYSEKLKENLEKAEMQTRLAYLAIEKAEAAGKKAKDVDLENAQEEYGITPEDIKNFNYAKVDSLKLASAVNIVSCANTAKSTFVGLRLQQKTKAQGVWYKAKQLQEKVSQRHPKLYKIVKTGAQAAKVAGINFALGATLGPIGVAGYGAYRTAKAIKKSVDAYKLKREKAKAMGEKYYPNYIEYITAKENRLEAIGLAATTAISLTGLGYSGAAIASGVASTAASNMAGKTIAVASVSLASGVALQREQAKAVDELKEFLLTSGIEEKNISRKDLYFSPKKYCAALIEKEGIKFSRSQKAEFEQKLDNLVKARAAKRARYASALIGSTSGLAAHELAGNELLQNVAERAGKLFVRNNGETTLHDSIQSPQEISTPSVDTLQQNDTVKLDENTIAQEPESKPEPKQEETTVRTAEKPIPNQKVSERLAQRSNNTPRAETYTPEAAQRASYNYADNQPQSEDVAVTPKAQPQDISTLDNPSEYYAVSQPEDNVFITQGGTRVDLVEDDGRIEAIYSNESNSYSDAECAEIDKNVYHAITEKQRPTDIEGRFAREYEETNNLPPADLTKSAPTSPELTEEQLIEKLGLQGKNVSVSQIEQDGKTITQVTVYPDGSNNAMPEQELRSQPVQQPQPQQSQQQQYVQQQPQQQPQQPQQQDHPLTDREARRQAREERRQARAEAKAREEAAEQWAAYDKKQGPTHKINMGPEYNNYGYGYGYNYGYYPQPSYSIREIPETGEPYLEISNYQPQVDNTLYNYVNSTRVNATNGVQYTEAMGGAIKGHPSNFDANAREFCTQLEQRDLVFKDLMNRQAAGYRLTEREARWVGDYQRDIAAYGLAYDRGRLVPILDQQHTMEKFYPNTLAQGGKVVDTVNYRAANNRSWDPVAYNTNNRAQINVITGQRNQGR